MSKRCKYTNAEVSLLGRLIRSEAVGEGNFGMMLVGNVVVNRVVARCLEFKRQKTIKFWRANPATSALWYYYPGKKKKCKSKFWGSFCGKYKNHCFYEPPSKKTCGL